ncbi:MAG: O-antigen ligase family protein [Verrucomicrobiota bacterium]
MVDIIKAIILASGYFIIGPIGGFILSKDRRMEDFAVGLLMFLLGLHINTTVLMLGSIEWYRGVTKGYEFTMMEILSASLIFATLFNSKRKFILFPMGTLLWFLYIGASSLSIFSALNINYVLMSILKHAKVWLIVLAVANYVRSQREVHVVLTGISIMLIYQFIIVAKMKWIDGFYQVRGLFEHQNPLAMFTYMAALPILAVAMSPATSKIRSLIYFAAFACSGIIVLASLSRAALVFFAMGTAAVVAAGFFDRISGKRILIVALMSMGGAFVLAMTLETIISRFNDEGNEASGETREVMNMASKAMIDANPLGVGWNNFGKAINHPYPYGDVIDDWNRDRGQKVDYDYAKGVVESHYWLLKGETGWLGYLTYMLFIIVVTGRTIPLIIMRRGSLEAAIAVGILVGFGITYVHSSLERVLTQTKNLALWMTYIGLLAALVRLPKLKQKDQTSLE